MFTIPPERVPENLTAQEYYELAVKYKQAGWIERCRQALNLAINSRDSGTISDKAKTYLKTKLPVTPVPPEAEKRNIEGFNHFISNPAKANEIWSNLIEDYPQFEWPYCNLGNSYLRRSNDPKSAIPILTKAVELNPCYTNALMLLAEAYTIEMDYPQAERYINQALDCDPEDKKIRKLKNSIEQVIALMGD